MRKIGREKKEIKKERLNEERKKIEKKKEIVGTQNK